ncbi:MAG: helix-turn-helix domain-containing protein [Anaerobutyricum hallii]
MFAERIKMLRKEKGITQVELAEAMGLSKGTIAMWEVGKREATFDTLCKLAEFFGKSIDYILGRSDDNSDEAYNEEVIDRILDVQPEEDVIKCINDYLRLDNYGQKAVQQLVKNEYFRCVEMDTLRDLFSHLHVVNDNK